jgi:hypothetical protein
MESVAIYFQRGGWHVCCCMYGWTLGAKGKLRALGRYLYVLGQVPACTKQMLHPWSGLTEVAEEWSLSRY